MASKSFDLNRNFLFLKRHHRNLILMPVNLIKNCPKTKFFIFCRGRSGSTLLSDLLNQHSKINCQGELFFNPVFSPKFKIKFYESINEKECFGFKILTYQCIEIQKFKNTNKFLKSLVNNGYRSIYLERSNIVHQAISNINAFEKKEFHHQKSIEKNTGKIFIELPRLKMWISILEKRKEIENQALKDFEYLYLNYETDLLDSSKHQDTLNKICSYLEIENENLTSNYRKIVPSNLRDFIINYEEIEKLLSKTPYFDQL